MRNDSNTGRILPIMLLGLSLAPSMQSSNYHTTNPYNFTTQTHELVFVHCVWGVIRAKDGVRRHQQEEQHPRIPNTLALITTHLSHATVPEKALDLAGFNSPSLQPDENNSLIDHLLPYAA